MKRRLSSVNSLNPQKISSRIRHSKCWLAFHPAHLPPDSEVAAYTYTPFVREVLSTRRLCAMQETWHSWGQQDGFVWASGLSHDDYHSLLEVCCPLACLATAPHISCACKSLSSPSALQCAHICQVACKSGLALATCWLQAA